MTYALCMLAGLVIGGLVAWLEHCESIKVAHYYLSTRATFGTVDRSINVLTPADLLASRHVQVREEPPPHGDQEGN